MYSFQAMMHHDHDVREVVFVVRGPNIHVHSESLQQEMCKENQVKLNQVHLMVGYV